MFNLRCKVSHLNGVQTKLKCKPNVKRCKRFVFPVRSHLFHHNALKTKAITFFQADHILTRFVFPPLYSVHGIRVTDIPSTTKQADSSARWTTIFRAKLLKKKVQ